MTGSCWPTATRSDIIRNKHTALRITVKCHENPVPISSQNLCGYHNQDSFQNGCHLPDNVFKCIFLNENVQISIEISLKFVPNGSINNIPSLVQIMAWRRPGDKPLPEPMIVRLPTHICVIQTQLVNIVFDSKGLYTSRNPVITGVKDTDKNRSHICTYHDIWEFSQVFNYEFINAL